MVHNDRNYHAFIKYLRHNVADWGLKKSEEALVEDAPKEAHEAFNEYVRKRNEMKKKGIIE